MLQIQFFDYKMFVEMKSRGTEYFKINKEYT